MSESAIKELMRLYPDIDHLMAETIFKMHDQGKLAKFLSEEPKFEPAPENLVLKTVSVE